MLTRLDELHACMKMDYSEMENMTSLSRDPIINVVYNGIKKGIRVALKNECYGSAVILIYSGIDTMAYLSMPDDQEDVKPKDFKKWADGYISFPCKEQVTGLELYGARCGMVHTYSISSRLSRQGKCREIGYVDQCEPEVRYNPASSTNLVIVSISALAEAFFEGVDKFLVNSFANKAKAEIVDKRLLKLVHSFPFEAPPDQA